MKMENKTQECEKYLEMILNMDSSDALRTHLDHCADCRALADTLRLCAESRACPDSTDRTQEPDRTIPVALDCSIRSAARARIETNASAPDGDSSRFATHHSANNKLREFTLWFAATAALFALVSGLLLRMGAPTDLLSHPDLQASLNTDSATDSGASDSDGIADNAAAYGVATLAFHASPRVPAEENPEEKIAAVLQKSVEFDTELTMLNVELEQVMNSEFTMSAQDLYLAQLESEWNLF